MSLRILKPTAEFADLLPKEYQELVENGPYHEQKGISDLGTFKEIIEEHPHCAGCGVALGVRLVAASLPAPADTLIIGTPGCSFFGLAQTALNYSNTAFGNQNAVASGLKRMLKIRYPDRNKDVVVLVGDGGIADIGLDMTLHSWLRRENITTIMVDNEVYGNTGGQESGMTKEGQVLNMAPEGKKFPKIPVFELARTSGCAYGARVTVASPRKIGEAVKKAILVAREVGPTYVQIYTPCPTNLKFPPDQTVKVAKDAEAGYYSFEEFISPEAQEYMQKTTKAV
ncbi:MAG: ferredoxin oxidoreductase [Clostridiales bacterium]|jgi:pyruvate ferredoxin oxidoreductase beta subunit|nr:ferredoxin oxidoreductase [Clostridiales bacterium]